MDDATIARREAEDAAETLRYNAAMAKARGPKLNRDVEDLCQVTAEQRGALRWSRGELDRLLVENSELRADVATLRRDLAGNATPDHGTLINAAASAGAAVVDARERLARTPQTRVMAFERARLALVAAEARKVEADAALATYTADEANRALVLAHLDAGHESTLNQIATATGVQTLDVLMVICEEARNKRVERPEGGNWRRPAGYVKAVL